MSGARRIAANRRNAARSTGPQSRRGKSRSARNALSHGLAVPVVSDPVLCAKSAALAQAIAGVGANPQRVEAARRIAEAEVDLLRVRQARAQLLSLAIAPQIATNPRTKRKNRALNTALAGTAKEAMGKPSPADTVGNMAALELLPQTLLEPAQQADVLGEFAARLARLDRYERRALSRRKSAIRAFDQIN
jgi:hypothetical protein